MRTNTCALLLAALMAMPVACTAQPATTMPSTTSPATQPQAVKYGAAATVNPIATDAAMDALRAGGNAVDAAVAAAVTLGVVDGHNSGIGGGCFIVIRLKDGRSFALDGREMAPAKATRDMYIRDGKGDTSLSQTGPLASGVPGALAAYDHAVKNFGKRSLADAMLPAARIAENGFRINGGYASKIRRSAEHIAKFEASRQLLLKPDGTPLLEGDMLVQTDLARTYRAIAQQGADYFYKGDFAKRIDAWMSANGGILTAEDFTNYQVKQREPLQTTYRGLTIIGMPPPSSGGVHVAQILAMLERFDLAKMSEADRLTTIANAMNIAFADRAHWLGDPDFAKVPRGLIDTGYLAEQSKRITSDKALPVEKHGTPPKADADFFERQMQKHTTHLSVADAEGNVVAITQTVNTAFGSKVVVPGTGVFLNNEMDDFSIQPGVPNAFKLVGAEANAVEAGKRPLSSMSPTIVLQDGKPIIAVGAAGGPTIITQVLCVLTNLIDLKQSPQQAMESPRIHHQWKPEQLRVERTVGADVIAQLKARGFDVDAIAPSGATNLIVIQGTKMTAVSEPRLDGKGSVE